MYTVFQKRLTTTLGRRNGSSRRLIFYCVLWHFEALYLRDGWAGRPETFTYDWKGRHLDFGGLKFGEPPPKKSGVNGLGAKSRSPLGRSSRNFAKRCELGGCL